MTAYNFRLSATNEKGQGPASPPVTYRTLPDVPKPPGAPTNKERPTSYSLCIEWQPPTDDGGSPIQNYILQMDEGQRSLKTGSSSNASGRSNGDGSSPTLTDVYTGPETSYKAEGLKPGRKYRFQVKFNFTVDPSQMIGNTHMQCVCVHVGMCCDRRWAWRLVSVSSSKHPGCPPLSPLLSGDHWKTNTDICHSPVGYIDNYKLSCTMRFCSDVMQMFTISLLYLNLYK